MDNRVSIRRTAWVILSSGADICGLQEVDKWNLRSGMFNQAKKLAELCSMNYVYGPNIRLAGISLYGCAILSRYPIIKCCNYKLPGSGEKRGFLKAVIRLRTGKIVFFTTHLGLDENDRVTQVQYIKEIISSEVKPLILTGDLNEEAGGPAVKNLLAGNLLNCLPPNNRTPATYPTPSPAQKIDYVLADNKFQLKKAGVILSTASDHLPYYADLLIDR
ncbi:MAG: endonuclease/exonuclease/phosphatase family protein [Desulfotomaculum sp.]|nr:endonuclease/exonuclease/phosphatase family protein [Desulfotomaculum sp.]